MDIDELNPDDDLPPEEPKGPSTETLLQQYRELCADARHIDNKMWIIPTGTSSVTFLALRAIIETLDPFISFFAAVANILVTVIFIQVFAKYRAYQIANDFSIKKLQDRIPGFVRSPSMANLSVNDLGYNPFWLVRFVSRYSGSILWMYFMLLILAGDFAILIWVIMR